jgi:hypothetical protein
MEPITRLKKEWDQIQKDKKKRHPNEGAFFVWVLFKKENLYSIKKWKKTVEVQY